MIARALLVALVLARAQNATPELAAGVETRAELPAGGEARFELDAGEGGAWTVQAGSLDFDVRLAVELATGGERREDSRSWGHSDAWLVFEAQAGSRWRVVVSAEDGRGGEFALTARAGRFDPPKDRRERILAAVEHCERISERAESRGDAVRAARHAGFAAEAAFATEAFERSARAAERQLRLAGEARLERETSRAALNLGAARRMLGELDAALALLERARPGVERGLAEAQGPRERAGAVARAAFFAENLADVLRELHGPARALPNYEQAAAYAAEVPNPRFTAKAAFELVAVLADLGRTKRAREELARVQPIVEAAEDRDLSSDHLSCEARLELATGHPARARALLQRALELVESPLVRIDLLGTLAGAAVDLGRYEEAEHALDELERLADERTLARFAVEILKTRSTIARLLGDDEAALRLAEESVERVAARPEHEAGEPLVQLAILHAVSGQPARARDLALEAIARSSGAAPLSVARILLRAGTVLESAGDLPAAWEAFERVATIAEQQENEHLAALAAGSGAYVLLRAGDTAAAAAPAAQSAATLEALGDLPGALDMHDTLAKVALRRGDLVGTQAELCEAERLLGELGEAPASVLREGQMRSRFAGWGEIAQELAVRLASDPGRRSVAWGQYQAWKAHVLLERRVPFGSRSASTRAIADDTVVVDYAEGFERLYAWVASRATVDLVDLGPKDEIAVDAAAFAQRILDVHVPPAELAALGARLYDTLIAPLRQRLAGRARTLVIVPSPAVASVPFDALVVPSSVAASGRGFAGLRYLIDEVAVLYAPSAGLLATDDEPDAGAGRVLILGDPTTRDEVSEPGPGAELLAVRAQNRLAELVRLTKTRDEALDLAGLVLAESRSRAGADQREFERSAAALLVARAARDVALETGPFDLYLGSRANAERLLSASGYRDIHVAAHGHVDPLDPRRSGLVLSWDARTGGLVTLEELATSRIDADLVVLSACETAGGRIVRGEGVQSVAYAFLLAGARNVVATLWRVGDLEASQMMQAFYSERLAGPRSDVAGALRRAKLSFRGQPGTRGVRDPVGAVFDASSAHPRFWAGYVAIAAPR